MRSRARKIGTCAPWFPFDGHEPASEQIIAATRKMAEKSRGDQARDLGGCPEGAGGPAARKAARPPDRRARGEPAGGGRQTANGRSS